MNFDLSTLNDEQIKPVLDTEGAVLVTAGAGSGKTRLLTHRIAHLIRDLKIPAYNVLAITFTNKAANEMKERLMNMVPEAEGLWVSTFHSMCVRILRRYIEFLGYTKNFSIYSENEKERIIKSISGGIEEEKQKKIIYAISEAKNEGLSPEEFCKYNSFNSDIDVITDIYLKYEEELKKNNALDFDDLLFKTLILLENCNDAREYYQEKFRFIHVDEFQDTNTVQYNLVKALSQKYKNVFVVGDEDQCIYGWRGANIDNIKSFIKDFDCRIYKLEQNYRSTQNILEMANNLIKNNTTRIEKNLWTLNNKGLDVNYIALYNDSEEADYVVYTILDLVKNKGYSYSDFAILMRVNALSRSFEQRLLQYNVPHKVFGGFKFFERKEIKDLLAYLRILVNHLDNEAILRVINFPRRGIGEAAVKQLVGYSVSHNVSLYDTIISIDGNKDLSPNLISKVSEFSKIIRVLNSQKDCESLSILIAMLVEFLNLKILYSEDTEENENRKMNIRDFIHSAEEYEQNNDEATLEDFLQMITLYTDLDDMNDDNCVKLATVHSAKGLEFKVVFIVGLEDGMFPVRRSLDTSYELEEERRLMYVAITRAKERLYITRTKQRFLYGTRKDSIPSRFLFEVGLEKKKEKAVFKEEPKSTKILSSYRTNEIPVSNNKDASIYQVGMTVKHKKFGTGVILNISEMGSPYAEIEFDVVGKITLALNFAPLEIVEE